MAYVIIVLSSFLLTLPLSPLLSKLGMSVCGLMRHNGFWFGCELNFKYLASLWILTSIASSAFYFLATNLTENKWNEKLDSSILFKNIFFFVSLLGFAWVFWNVSEAIAATNSVYQDVISAILLVVGLANILIQALLIEILIFRFEVQHRHCTLPSQSRSLLNRTSDFLHFTLGPVLVISCFFYFVVRLVDVEEDGFSGLGGHKQILIGFVLAYLVWLVAFIALSQYKTRTIVRSLTLLSQQLSQFNSREKISLFSFGSYEPVAHGLNQSLEILSQRSLLIQNFSKFVSDKLLDTVVRADAQTLQGVKTKCVVIMTDLRDFTNVSSRLAPEDVVKLLNLYFQDMIGVLNAHGISIDKFIGDGLLAYIPVESMEDSAGWCERALAAVVAMVNQMQATNQKLREMNLPEMRIGAGLHIGEVILGAMGSQTRLQYTIIGDTVNRAARLESLCKSLSTDIVISKALFDLLPQSSKDSFEESREVELKGISSKESVYFRTQAAQRKSA